MATTDGMRRGYQRLRLRVTVAQVYTPLMPTETQTAPFQLQGPISDLPSPTAPGIQTGYTYYATDTHAYLIKTADGGWEPVSGGTGVPSHAITHAAGGVDPLTVDEGHADLAVTDPGHTHAVPVLVVDTAYSIGRIDSPGTGVGTIASNVSPGTVTSQPDVPRLIDVTFPATWSAGNVVVTGKGRSGATVTESFAYPVGGGTVNGTKVFYTVTSITTTTSPTLPATTANVVLGDWYGVPQNNVDQFLKCSVDGVNDPNFQSDVASGTFEPALTHHGNHTVTVWYTYRLSPTVGSSTTGVGVADNGHAHALSS